MPLTPVLDRFRRPGDRRVAPLLMGAVAAVVVVATFLPVAGTATNTASARAGGSGDDGVVLPPAPSGRPDPTAGIVEPSNTSPASGDGSSAVPLDAPWQRSAFTDDSLTALVEGWRSDAGIDGVALVVSLPDGDRRSVTIGVDEDGSPMATETVRPVTSVTKTMTAAIALQLVDDGLLDLDAPLGEIPGAGPLPGGATVTVRQLLDHSSGIAPYQEAPGYDADLALDSVTAVRASLATALQWEPGAQSGYSNSGFLALGLLIENATGAPFADALADRVIRPAGLTATGLEVAPTAGWVGGAAGGVVSTVEDLATWGEALYRNGTVLSTAAHREMTTIDATRASGLGTFPVCPCAPVGDGSLAVTSIGHNGGSVTLQYAPGDGIVIAAAFSESFWTTSFDQAAVYGLLERVRQHVTA